MAKKWQEESRLFSGEYASTKPYQAFTLKNLLTDPLRIAVVAVSSEVWRASGLKILEKMPWSKEALAAADFMTT